MNGFDRDGFFEVDLIPLIRDARNAEFGTNLGPINMMALKKIRQNAMTISKDVVAKLPDNPYAEGISRRLIDGAFITTNKPMIAWTADDVAEGINAALMVMDDVSEENLMTYMDVVVQTLLRLKDKRWINPMLVTPDLTVYLTLKAQEAISMIDDADAEDEFVDAQPMPGLAQMVADEAMARGINPLTDKEAFLAFANSPEQIEKRRMMFDFEHPENMFGAEEMLGDTMSDWEMSAKELDEADVDDDLARGYWQAFGTYERATLINPEIKWLGFGSFEGRINANNYREYLLFANTWIKMITALATKRRVPKKNLRAMFESYIRDLNGFASEADQLVWSGNRVVLAHPEQTTLRDMPMVRTDESDKLRGKTVKNAKVDNVISHYYQNVHEFMDDLRETLDLPEIVFVKINHIMLTFALVAANDWHRNTKSITGGALVEIMKTGFPEKDFYLSERFLVPFAIETYAEWANDAGELTEDEMFKWFNAVSAFEEAYAANLINEAVKDEKVTLPL